MLRALKPFSLLVLLALVSACATTPKVKSPEANFKEGVELYDKHDWEEAIKSFKKVKEAYSSAELTTKSELYIADAHFENKAYIEAAAAYEDFRKLHPSHEKAAYALYRFGLSHYREINGIDTDQTPVKSAHAAFDTFLAQYPKSEYAAEVKEKRDDCVDKELQYEIYVGSYYLRTGSYPSAIKRLSEALAKFPKTPHQPENLYYLGKAYLKQGDREKGTTTLKRLAAEYPDTKWNKDGQELLAP
ncbi:outer membrane protein assembly factor BamD [Geomesophilobacter sediminis]|uniref:Outer membrane protein assembly factor BamD n=1 Tax=Geomesophilobacter sediminis TaxID=2798584 RepID=A0A8J7M120_9BACT|nr:outer membrane protein assembly factor BamD [Geomesophilobacter sediminis]MBJ6726649.1 outer membrane protein assembly factor BamD [Geomesophilobacter sediminis]